MYIDNLDTRVFALFQGNDLMLYFKFKKNTKPCEKLKF
jgi:hypothetical protein